MVGHPTGFMFNRLAVFMLWTEPMLLLCRCFESMQMIRRCHEMLVKQFNWDDQMNRAIPDNYVRDTSHVHDHLECCAPCMLI
jgi:hypothetical protein